MGAFRLVVPLAGVAGTGDLAGIDLSGRGLAGVSAFLNGLR